MFADRVELSQSPFGSKNNSDEVLQTSESLNTPQGLNRLSAQRTIRIAQPPSLKPPTSM